MKRKKVVKELKKFLDNFGIDDKGVYRVDIDQERLIVYRYKFNEKGRKYLINDNEIATEEIAYWYE